MAGVARAFGRLLIMGGVMAAVLVTGLVAGVGTTIAVALAIVLAGSVGLVGVARRPNATAILGRPPAPVAEPEVEVERPTGDADPEALMPRWRRPSLIEARRVDPAREPTRMSTPQRFVDRRAEADLRVVRYAVVPVMDCPDEILGVRLTDLGAGDEVRVVGSSDTFLEIICSTGERGWIHRTTVTPPAPSYLAPPRSASEPGAEDALSALLAARGLQ